MCMFLCQMPEGKILLAIKWCIYRKLAMSILQSFNHFPSEWVLIGGLYCSSREKTDLQSGNIPDFMNLTGHGLATTLRINKASA